MEQFVQAFRDFDLNGGEGSIDVEELVKQTFTEKYDIPAEQAVLATGANTLTELVRELLDELVEHLTDLDYLDSEFLKNYQAEVKFTLPTEFAQPILQALRAFLADDEVLQGPQLDISGINLSDLTSANDLVPIVVQRLNLLTSFDGEFEIDEPLHMGDQNLLSRVFLYRMQALGQLSEEERVSDVITDEHIIGVTNIEVWLREREPNQVAPGEDEILTPKQFALTGNAHRMFKQYCKHHRQAVLFYHCPVPGSKVEAKYQHLVVFRKNFVSATNQNDFERACDAAKVPPSKLQQMFFTRSVDGVGASGNRQNKFGINLLQLKLWMYGFYYGLIDGDYGPLSHTAFFDLLEHENQDKKRRRQRIVLSLDQDFWAVNLPRAEGLFRKLDKNLDKAEEREDELIEGITEENEGPILDAQSSRRQMEVSSFWENARMAGRRLYQGVRSIVAVALHGLKRVRKWLRRKLKKIVGAVVSFLKNVFKRIREGVQIFYRAMRRFGIFILRKPLITPENFRDADPGTPVILTRFDFDLDVVILQCEGIAAAVRQTHERIVRNVTHALTLFLKIAALAIELIASLRPPFGWVRLGVKLGQLIAELVGIHIRLPRLPAPIPHL